MLNGLQMVAAERVFLTIKIGAVLQKSSKFQTCSMAKLSVSIVQVCSPDGATKV